VSVGELAVKRCPFCAEEIQDAAIVCRFCQRDLPSPQPRTSPVIKGIAIDDPVHATESTSTATPSERVARSGGSSWQWKVLLGLGAFLLFLIVLGIDSQNSPRARRSEVGSTSAATSAPPKVATPDLELLSQTGGPSGGGGYMEVSGEVKNLTSEPLRNVHAVVTWYTEKGDFIASDTALIEYNPLMPGQTSPYKTMSRRNPVMEKFRVDFKTMSGALFSLKRPPSK
jgi:hypothetical protein